MQPDPFHDSPPPDLYILIGHPGEEALADLMARDLPRVVLVEPDPGFSDQAGRIHAGLEIVAAAPGETEGPVELIHYNQPGLRSLRSASEALQALLPGLRVRRRSKVMRITPKALLQRIGEFGDAAVLRIDFGGEEMALLAGLEAEEALAGVVRLELRCGVEPFFEGAAGAGELREWLSERGFVKISEENDDPDWPVLTFAPDMRLRRLKKALTDREAEVGELRAELAAQTRQAATLQARWEALAGQIEALQTERDRARGELAEARDAQSLTLGDLHELQQRFQETEAARIKQADLLQKLTPRLQQAAAELRELVPGENIDHKSSPQPQSKRRQAARAPRKKAAGKTGSANRNGKAGPGGKAR